jgi:hypothetical protein
MEFNESGHQDQEGHYDNYDAGYRDPFAAGSYTQQKLYTQAPVSSRVSAGQRLALAIVSLCIMIPLAGIIFGISTSFGLLGPIYALIGMGIVCLTIMVVNIAFNRS